MLNSALLDAKLENDRAHLNFGGHRNLNDPPVLRRGAILRATIVAGNASFISAIFSNAVLVWELIKCRPVLDASIRSSYL